MKSLLVLAIVGFASLGWAPQQELPHTWSNDAYSSERTDERLVEVAEILKTEKQRPTISIYDIGYPHTAEEYTKLGGNAILLLTSMAHNKESLPVQQLFVTDDQRWFYLKKLSSVLSRNADTMSSVSLTLGTYREDGMYLVPISLRMMKARVYAQFAGDSLGTLVGNFGSPLSKAVREMIAFSPEAGEIDEDFLEEFIEREYPGFMD